MRPYADLSNRFKVHVALDGDVTARLAHAISRTSLKFRILYWMSATTNIMAELIRAANEVSSLTTGERRHLMVRASRAVKELRLKTGARPGRGKDALFELEIAAMRSENNSDEASAILLKLADMIRTLKIVLDTKVQR